MAGGSPDRGSHLPDNSRRLGQAGFNLVPRIIIYPCLLTVRHLAGGSRPPPMDLPCKAPFAGGAPGSAGTAPGRDWCRCPPPAPADRARGAAVTGRAADTGAAAATGAGPGRAGPGWGCGAFPACRAPPPARRQPRGAREVPSGAPLPQAPRTLPPGRSNLAAEKGGRECPEEGPRSARCSLAEVPHSGPRGAPFPGAERGMQPKGVQLSHGPAARGARRWPAGGRAGHGRSLRSPRLA